MKLKTFTWLAFCLAPLAAALYYAPFFLIVSDQPVKSDAVILFLGGEKGTREKEANQLVRDGFADYLIIPAYRQIKKQSPDGKLIRLDTNLILNARDSGRTNEPTNQQTSSNSPPNQPTNEQTKLRNWVVEDTHQEALIARDMMKSRGVKSAILVSSPYHMRRIKFITGKVFEDSLVVRFVPTRYETPSDGFWLFNNYERKFVLTEYMKIGWFLLYSPFV